jgi:polyisoprenoid-binding protein YceI
MLMATPAFASDHYEFDKGHTSILFFVDHLGFSDMVGFFTAYSGGFTFDPAHPEASTIDVSLDPSGIRTSSTLLDHILQGEKFFNTDKFPAIRFVSEGITATGAHTGNVTGNLTMLGVTKPLTLHVHFNKAGYHPMTQNFVAGFSAEGTLKRSDFGMNYLIPMVGDQVRFMIQTEAIDLDRKNAERIKH